MLRKDESNNKIKSDNKENYNNIFIITFTDSNLSTHGHIHN